MRVKNAVPTTENWPLQIIFLTFPDTTIYNKRTIQLSSVHLGSMVVMFFCVLIQFSSIHLGSMVVMFFVVYWLLV